MDFVSEDGSGLTSRVTTRATSWATVGREESPSRASSPQRPICSRRRLYIPAAVPVQWFRLMVFGSPDIAATSRAGVNYHSRRDRHFSGQSHSSGGRQGADRQADDGFACQYIGTGKTFNQFCAKMLSATANCIGTSVAPNRSAKVSRTAGGLILYGTVLRWHSVHQKT